MQTLNEIWTELGERVRSFVDRRVRDPHAAEDITQDVMLKVQSQLDALPPEDKLPAWVLSIARNTIVDYYRARAVRQHSDVADVEVAAETDESGGAMQQLTSCLSRMLEHLPEPYREAMRLADLEQVTQQEIAERMGVSLSGAKSRVQRARKQLREMLEACCRIEQDARGNVLDYQTTPRASFYCGKHDSKPPCGN